MPLTAAHLRKLADELDAEDEQAKRDLAEADSKAERDALLKRIEALEKERDEVADELADAGSSGRGGDTGGPSSDAAADEDDPPAKKRTRPGRKRGDLYQVQPGGPGQIWDGEDEPDEVEIDDEAGAA